METLSKQDKIRLLSVRDGMKCAICNKKMVSDVTIDHWIPRSIGGSDDLENLRLAHKKCNAWKGNRVPNSDGTIPAKEPKRSPIKNKLKKKELKEAMCGDCNDGRLLNVGEVCSVCGSLPGPNDWPHWAKRRADKCMHSPPEWCWACSIGIVDRKPVFLVLLEGEN